MAVEQLIPFLTSPDLFIAGAGPSGLACAIAAARCGFKVEVADARRPPIDKACGEGLLPDALAALDQLGLPLERLQPFGLPFRGIRFIRSDSPLHHSPADALFPSGCGLGIRRTALHRLLVDHALSLGVRFRWQTVVTGIAGNQVRTNRGTVHSRWIVGADGHQSRIRTFAGLDRSSATYQRIGLRQHYAVAPWSDLVEVHWALHGQAYVTPISPEEVCVAFIGSKKFADAGNALSQFPTLHRHLASTTPIDKARGAVTLSRRLHRVTSRNIALIGDASGSVDAITGEGLVLAFRQAIALAEALAANDLPAYQQAHESILRLPHHMSRALLLMDRHPLILSRVFTAFKRHPTLFPHLLGIHNGDKPLRLLGTGSIAASLLAILTA
jgi:menaquinone-9 beta-reductase